MLEEEYERLRNELARIGYICSGSVMTLYRTCGKPNCGCREDRNLQHGPYHIWTRKEKGKTVTRSLSKNKVEVCSEYIRNLHRMEEIIERMKNISFQMIELAK